MNSFPPAFSSPAARVAGAFAALGLIAAALFGSAAPASAHDQLIDSVVEESGAGEATALRLTFSNNVLEVGTEMLVTDEAGNDATGGSAQVSGRDVTVPLNAPLPDGSYRAVWRVVSSDGHPIDGGFSFDISDGAASPLRTLDLASPSQGDAADDAADAAEQPATSGGDAPDFGVFAPYLIAGVVLAGGVVVAAVIMRARKNASGSATQDSSKE